MWRTNSLRLPRFNYARKEGYCVTLVTEGRRCLFADSRSSELNEAGRTASRIWRDLPNRFRVRLAFVVMPDHFHGILILQNAGDGNDRSLGQVIGAFKSLTTLAYVRGIRHDGWRAFNGQLWQRNYYERVIRDHASLRHIRRYIGINPAGWRREHGVIP